MKCLPRPPLALGIANIGIVLLTLAAGARAGAPADRAEYFRRLAALSPRDPQAIHDLALWCGKHGLEGEATALLQRVIRVDPDHAAARAALGYRRFGLGWILESGARPRPPRSRSSPQPGPGEETATPEAEKRQPPSEGPGRKPAGDGEGGASAPDAPAPDPVAAKRSFAAAAAEALKRTFNTKEDADFLLHTTHKLSSPQFRKLVSTLAAIKKRIRAIAGGPSKAAYWPGKVQIFLLRNVQECVQFSEVVDGQRFPEGKGWYEKDGHIVLFLPEEEALTARLAETALDHLGGSDRFVPWWLRIGVSEFLASQTEEGIENRRGADAFLLVAKLLADGLGARTHVANLLETPGMGASKTSVRESRAMALTLVEFLVRSGKRRMQKLIAELKSEAAPEPPADLSDKKAFRRFFIELIAYQENAIRRAFGLGLDALDRRWKQFVLKRAATLEEPGRGAAPPGRRRRRG